MTAPCCFGTLATKLLLSHQCTLLAGAAAVAVAASSTDVCSEDGLVSLAWAEAVASPRSRGWLKTALQCMQSKGCSDPALAGSLRHAELLNPPPSPPCYPRLTLLLLLLILILQSCLQASSHQCYLSYGAGQTLIVNTSYHKEM